ncbi:capsid cement protein [Nonomuraea indica]|uniref:capsid cement protein n=1 Tax=Nonomuraea indica TaxID=1581193 RepID=UPI000C7CD93A|nr:capsid cement protein [Nonomuraea indica]
MSDYLPIFTPAETATFTTSAAVTGGQLLAVSGNGTVAPAAAGSASWIGVASGDATSGARVTVFCRGTVHESTASGAITAGAQLATGAAGTVASLAAAAGATAGDINSARGVIGVALTTAADAAKVRWMAW